MKEKRSILLQVFIHTVVWLFIIAMPFLTFWHDSGGFSGGRFMHQILTAAGLMTVFYINFFFLIDRLLFKKKEIYFILWNLLLIVGVAFLVSAIKDNFVIEPHFEKFKRMNEAMHRPPGKPQGAVYAGFFREFVSLILAVGICMALKMTTKWYSTEAERKESEAKQTEAELNNLKQQLNPHFLFNTLNNIYALVEISPEKAQTAILDLSKMLRYQLYDNQQNLVLVKNELSFLNNYIQLMQLRLSDNVELLYEVNVKSNEKLIVPFMFITLIENAFKHGISSSKPSFIHINIFETETKEIICKVENSYFPKDDTDRSGSGIGVENLQRRLAILFPNSKLLLMEKDGASFRAILTLPLQ